VVSTTFSSYTVEIPFLGYLYALPSTEVGDIRKLAEGNSELRSSILTWLSNIHSVYCLVYLTQVIRKQFKEWWTHDRTCFSKRERMNPSIRLISPVCRGYCSKKFCTDVFDIVYGVDIPVRSLMVSKVQVQVKGFTECEYIMSQLGERWLAYIGMISISDDYIRESANRGWRLA
jgi:hypothetical protein